MTDPKSKSIMHNLGQFIGHVWTGIKANPDKHVIRHETEQEQRTDEEGRTITLRRTTIEEVEVQEDPPPPS